MRIDQLLENDLPEPYLQLNILTRGNFRMERHCHDFWQLILVTDGVLEVRTERTDVLCAGMLHILPPGLPHELYSEGGYRQLGLDLGKEPCHRSLVPLLVERFNSPAVVRLPEWGALTDGIIDACTAGTPAARARLGVLFDTLVLRCLEDDRAENGFDHRLTVWLDRHLGEPLRLSDIAAEFFVSVPQLERNCRAAFGTGVMAQLQFRRFRRAQQLLLETSLPVREVGAAVGYPDPTHFSGFFRKRAGMSAKEYRAKGKNYA